MSLPRADATGDPPMPGAWTTLDDWPLWLGEPSRISLEEGGLRPGLCQVEVSCGGPAYVTLLVEFRDRALAPLRVALDAVGGARYLKTLSLAAEPLRAVVEILPGAAAAPASIRAGPVGWRALARLAVRAACRHASRPALLAAKARQAMRGGASLVFTAGSAGAPPPYDYAAWRAAFETDADTERLLAAHRTGLAGRPSRVLVVVPEWRGSVQQLAAEARSMLASRQAEIHVVADAAGPGGDPECWQGAASLVSADADQLSRAVRAAIEGTRPHLVVFADTPGSYHPLAFACLGLALARRPAALAAYADHDLGDAHGNRTSPVFKPAWSPDYELAAGYVGAPVAFRPEAVARSEAEPISQATLLRDLARSGRSDAVAHVPRVLFHAAGETPPLDRVRPRPAPAATTPLVSVIVPTRDNPAMLAAAVRSVREAEAVASELIVVDNGAESEAQRAALARLADAPATRVVAAHGEFNFSDLVNRGRAAAQGDVLVLLNDDVEALSRTWLAALVAEALRPGIGCVGALLLYPDGRVQHAGVLLGINGGAGHACRFLPGDAPGPGCRLVAPREVSAVTAACLAVRTRVFDEAGGFDRSLPVTLNDVDFCLRVAALGYRNLFTPEARLIHREATSRGLDASPEKLARLSRETARFMGTWRGRAAHDPYMSPHQSPASEAFLPRRL